MVGERARLLEAVEEAPIDDRDIHPRASDPLLHRLPLFVGEVSSGSHAEEYGCCREPLVGGASLPVRLLRPPARVGEEIEDDAKRDRDPVCAEGSTHSDSRPRAGRHLAAWLIALR